MIYLLVYPCVAVGAIVAGVVALVGSVISAISNRATARENSKREFDMQRQLINEQNAYNSPGAVSSRYRSAGINPTAAFSSGTAQGLQSSAGDAPSIDTPELDLAGPLGTAGSMLQQEKLIEAQRSLLQEQEHGVSLDNQDKQNKLDDYETERDKKFANLDADTAVKQSQKNLNDLNADLADLEKQLKSGEITFKAEEYDRLLKKYDAEIDLLKSNKNLTEQQIKEGIQAIEESKQRVNESQSREALNYAEKKLKDGIAAMQEDEKRKLKAEADRIERMNDSEEKQKAIDDLLRKFQLEELEAVDGPYGRSFRRTASQAGNIVNTVTFGIPQLLLKLLR
ncbi:DNA pilot protein [Dipodfec virus UOA04_Rod_841]|nr:DNA pilot protein [Dipodfec virus UOA04_Rod_841]